MCCTYKDDDEMCLLGWRCLCCAYEDVKEYEITCLSD